MVLVEFWLGVALQASGETKDFEKEGQTYIKFT